MDYYIYRGTSEATLAKIGTVTDVTSYTDTDVVSDTKYFYAVSAYNGKTESAKSTVVSVTTSTVGITSVTLALDKTEGEVGDTLTATVTILPADATNKAVTYESSDTGVATVSGTGVVTIIGAGTATITAKTADGKSDSVDITAYEALLTVSNLATSAVTATSVTLTWEAE